MILPNEAQPFLFDHAPAFTAPTFQRFTTKDLTAKLPLDLKRMELNKSIITRLRFPDKEIGTPSPSQGQGKP